MSSKFIIFDVETNGLYPGKFSVLSLAALFVQTWKSNGSRYFEIQSEFNRYYYPQAPYNRHAISVNGLTQKVISNKRENTSDKYPLHFVQDQEVSLFCWKTDLAVCHNTPFYSRFIKHAHELSKHFLHHAWFY